jgi:transketolase
MTYEEKLEELCSKDNNIRILTAENRAAIQALPQKLGNRFIDFGIAEQTLVGAAAGLALRGRIPIVHALATFLTMRAFEFIRTDVGIPQLPVKLIGGIPGFLSDGNGPTHQALEDISLMRTIPSMHIFCPSDAEDMVDGMNQILKSPFPCYMRFNARPSVVKHTVPFIFGASETISEGFDVTILTYGMLLEQAVIAHEQLEKAGVSVRLINIRGLHPIDETAILRAARETKLIVSLEDHFLTGGLYSILCEILVRYRIAAHVMPIALDQKWFRPGLLPDVLVYEGFTGRQIALRILEKFASLTPQRQKGFAAQGTALFTRSIC